MKQFFSIVSFCLFLFSCNQISKSDILLEDFIPHNSAVIIKSKGFETLASDIKNNEVISLFTSQDLFSKLQGHLSRFENLSLNEEVIICISDRNDLTFLSKYDAALNQLDSLPNTEDIFSNSLSGNILIASTSQQIIDNVSEPTKNNELFKLLNLGLDNNSVSIVVNTTYSNNLLDLVFEKDKLSINKLADWVALNIRMEQDKIEFNGVSKTKDSLPKLLSIFKNTIPQTNTSAQFTPDSFESLLSLTFDDFKVFHQNLKNYEAIDIKDSTNLELFKSIKEIGVITRKNDLAVILISNDIIEAKETLIAEQEVSSSFRQINIFNFSNTELFKKALNPLVNKDVSKYFIVDNALIFSTSQEFLKDVINSYQNNKTLDKNEKYQDLLGYLNDDSSLLFVSKNEHLKSMVQASISDSLKNSISNLNFKKYSFSAIQLINDNNLTHVNGIIKKDEISENRFTISEQYNVKLDHDLLTNPQIVKNHRNNQKEIVVQDINNNLYLISNRGKVLWKKKLDGNILGEIEQIDIYKNGRLQLAFATPKRLYLLDRNGKSVQPFPLKFNDEITQPLSVFDYDRKKKYRFLVVQGDETFMLDTKGKTVKGFNYKKASEKILTQPKHFRIGTKDYIVFASGKKLNILDRTGKTRVAVNQNFNFSDNEIYLYQNKFSFSNSKGQLVQADTKGRVSYKNLLLPEDHSITATSKTLVTQSSNNFTIKGKSLELDFGDYTKPEIFYLRDKIYVATTDMQSQKAYLFDSQTKSIQNFPVFGNSTLQLDNFDRDRNLEFVIKGEANSLVLYQIN